MLREVEVEVEVEVVEEDFDISRAARKDSARESVRVPKDEEEAVVVVSLEEDACWGREVAAREIPG